MSCDFRVIDYNYVFKSNVTLTPSTEDANFPVTNLQKFFRSKIFRTTTAATAQNIVIDLNTAEEIDSFAMIWDPVLGIKLSSAATYKLQASATDVWTSPPVDITLSLNEDNATITHFFASAEEYRYWRVVITDTANPYGYIEFPKLVLGKKLTFARSPQSGFILGYSDLSQKQVSLYGHEYVDIYPIKKRLEFDFNYLSASDSETLWNSYARVGSVTPILVCLDSQEAVFDKDRVTIYGKYDADLAATHVIRDLMNARMVIQEAF